LNAIEPIERTDENFVLRHNLFLTRIKEKPIRLLFLGDSIIRRWEEVPDLWNNYYGKYQPANFGIGADTTNNLIWRLENGELDGINPDAAVLLIGTNNSETNTGLEIYQAIKHIIDMIHKKTPTTTVILLGIFPRGEGKIGLDSDKQISKEMKAIWTANDYLSKLDNNKNIRYLYFGHKFLNDKNEINEALMPDRLHIIEPGYKIWAESMKPLIEEILN
jgi:lysophospholipase L1-like esterase